MIRKEAHVTQAQEPNAEQSNWPMPRFDRLWQTLTIRYRSIQCTTQCTILYIMSTMSFRVQAVMKELRKMIEDRWEQHVLFCGSPFLTYLISGLSGTFWSQILIFVQLLQNVTKVRSFLSFFILIALHNWFVLFIALQCIKNYYFSFVPLCGYFFEALYMQDILIFWLLSVAV